MKSASRSWFNLCSTSDVLCFLVELTESVDEIPKPISEKSKLALQFQTYNSAGTSWSFSGDVNCQERTYHSEIWVHDRYRLDQFTCQITVACLLSVWSEFPRSWVDIWSWSIAAALARKLTKRFCFNYFRYQFYNDNRKIDNSILQEQLA
jgi:hypothetical protein